MKKIAVIPAQGIGDALIMLIASNHLRSLGYEVTTLSNHLSSFGKWLSPTLKHAPLLENSISSYDALLIQYDNSPRAKKWTDLRQKGLPVYVFYITHHLKKHGPLINPYDYEFDHSISMVKNCQKGCEKLFGGAVSLDIGFSPPMGLVHRKFPRRVAIHPTSTSTDKNWPIQNFLSLSKRLITMGFEPLFLMSPEERKLFPQIDAPHIPTLEDLASLIFESNYFIGNDSGPAHIASYFSLPHIVIAQNKRQMRLWKPGWYPGEVVTPPDWLLNLKWLRWREKYWKKLISVNLILDRFNSLIK